MALILQFCISRTTWFCHMS